MNLKALITPPEQTQWMLGGELGLASAMGNTDALTGTWDHDGLDLSARLNLTYQHMNPDQRTAGLRLHANAGYLARTSDFDVNNVAFAAVAPNIPARSRLHGDQFLYGVGLEIPVPQGWTLFTEWGGEYDVESDAEFMDNPMRVTPGIHWSSPASSMAFTTGVELALSNEGSVPGWQVITGISFGGYLTPVSGHVRGMVRDAETGEPLSDVHVSVRNTEISPTRTDFDGRFETELEEGYAVLEFAADGYNPKTRVVEVSPHDVTDFDFTLTKRNVFGGLRGRVRDAETGEPLFARIRVAGTNEWVESDPATGSFAIEKIEEGERSFEIEARNYLGESVVARVSAGDVTSQDVSLVRDRSAMIGVISGQVRDAKAGTAVAATITARGADTVTVQADPVTGLYELELVEGSYNIAVTSSGYIAEVQSIEVAPKDVAVQNFEMNVLPKKMTLQGVFFDSGTATIKRESFAMLEEAATFLLENDAVKVVIEGHTDSTGSLTTNMALSQRRADAVMKFLVVNYGVKPVRLSARGLGPQEPIAENETPEGRAMNRRIEFRLEEAN